MAPGKTVDIDFTNFHNIINGQKRDSKNKHQGTNPITGELLWEVPIGNQQDVDQAVEAAQKAFKSWSQVPLDERKQKINNFADLYSQYTNEFMELLKKETGKPIKGAQAEVFGVPAFLKYHCK